MGQNGELMGVEFLLVRRGAVWKCSKIKLWWWLYTWWMCFFKKGQNTEFYPLSWQIVWYMNYISKSLLKTSLKYFDSSPGLGIIVTDWVLQLIPVNNQCWLKVRFTKVYYVEHVSWGDIITALHGKGFCAQKHMGSAELVTQNWTSIINARFLRAYNML